MEKKINQKPVIAFKTVDAKKLAKHTKITAPKTAAFPIFSIMFLINSK
jgi:hypothetical protein